MNQKNISTKENFVGTDKIVACEYSQNSPSSCFVMCPITEAQVSRLVSSLNVQKSSLHVPYKLIKIAAKPLLKPLAQLYNHSITTGIELLFLFSAFNMVVTSLKANGCPGY